MGNQHEFEVLQSLGAVHLQGGRKLLPKREAEADVQAIFEALPYLNLTRELITDDIERKNLAA